MPAALSDAAVGSEAVAGCPIGVAAAGCPKYPRPMPAALSEAAAGCPKYRRPMPATLSEALSAVKQLLAAL